MICGDARTTDDVQISTPAASCKWGRLLTAARLRASNTEQQAFHTLAFPYFCWHSSGVGDVACPGNCVSSSESWEWCRTRGGVGLTIEAVDLGNLA